MRRIARCQPWCDGGHDPVPAEKPRLFTQLLSPYLDKEVFMNDIRRTILWVIFGFSMVLLWDQWQVYNGNKATFFPIARQDRGQRCRCRRPPRLGRAGCATAMPAAVRGTGAVPAAPARSRQQLAPTAAPRERIEVTTDVLKLTFDTQGGSIVRSEFLKHADLADNQKATVLLDESSDRVYVAQTGLIGGAHSPTTRPR